MNLRLITFYFILFASIAFAFYAFGQTFFEASDVTDMDFSDYSILGIFQIKGVVGDVLGTFSTATDDLNPLPHYSDGAEYATETRTLINMATVTSLLGGEYITANFNRGTALMYLPEYDNPGYTYYYCAIKWEADGYYYVSTYNDEACTDLAQSALCSPSPTPSVTPTPTVTHTPTVTPTPSIGPTMAPTATPECTPSPTPEGYKTPSPTPFCAPVGSKYYLWNIDDASITTVRSEDQHGWRYRFFDVVSGGIYGDLYDSSNFWYKDSTDLYGALAVTILTNTDTPAIRAGDVITLTTDNPTAELKVYFPVTTSDTTFYIGDDGSTYTDITLCDLAYEHVPTPTPSPAVTPTPYVGLCLEFPHYPFTADETSIYQQLNDDLTVILAFANGGINSACFDPAFSIAYGMLGANVVELLNMRDDSVGSDEIIDGSVDWTDLSGAIPVSKLDTVYYRFDDVFPINWEITFSSDTTGTEEWRSWCNLTGDDQGTLSFSHIESDGSLGDTVISFTEDSCIIYADVTAIGDIAHGKLYSTWISFTANDTAPSVDNGVNFETANTSSTTITNFLEGSNGQEIAVFVNDSNTSFSEASNTISFGALTDGTTWPATQNDIAKFIRYDDVWYRIKGCE